MGGVLTTFATAEGTRRYAERFAGRTAPGYFREAQGLLLSSIGVGTYLGEPDERTDAAYTEALVAAVERGANVLDAAINYRFQRSERSVGAALKQLAGDGYARDEVVLCTKGGYLTPDGAVPPDAGEYFFREYIESGVLRPEDVAAGCHAMTPRYLDDQLGRSLRNLGVETIDVYYLHNPETQLSAVPRPEFLRRLRAAFEYLESAVAAGKIRFYGLATWNAFRQEEGGRDALSLAEAVAMAHEVAGEEHHFRFVQLPFNLAMTEALTVPNQAFGEQRVSTVEAAQALGVTLVASAALLQGQLTQNLPDFIASGIGLSSDAHRALQFARSAPGIATALVGMSRAAHAQANLELAAVEPMSPEAFLKLFSRSAGAE
jgi:aryl-alcohol dehydrogenase-like predicted oxidoreductase